MVDDDPIQNLITSQLISNQLDTQDYMVFNNGEEVLKEIENGNRPTVILLDINMPIMDGWEFLKNYKKFKNKASVVLLTSSINSEDMNKSKEYDFVKGYYTKPVDLSSKKEIFSSEDSH